MLQVYSRGSNNIVVWIANELLILISYETPVAFVIKRRGIAIINEKYTSQTTRKHIAKFFRDIGVDRKTAEEEPDGDFQILLENAMIRSMRGLETVGGKYGRV